MNMKSMKMSWIRKTKLMIYNLDDIIRKVSIS